MNGDARPMWDDEFDRVLTDYLAWRSRQVDGVLPAESVARRIWIERRRSGWSRMTRLLIAAGLAIGGAMGLLATGGRLPEAGDRSPEIIVAADSAGWTAIDPISGAKTAMQPCEGACPGAIFPAVSADGRQVYVVETTPTGADLRPDAPGWSIWRWDRVSGTVTKFVGCAARCSIVDIAPSPDGRHVAFIESDAPLTARAPLLHSLVVVDALSGREVERFIRTDLRVIAWDEDGRLLLTMVAEGSAVARYERIDLETSAEEIVGRGLPSGILYSSPDGRKILHLVPGAQTDDLYLADQELTTSTRFARIVAPGVLGALGAFAWSWSPDGSRIALTVAHPDPISPTMEIRAYAFDTGDASVVGDVLQGTTLMWLPALERP